MPSIILASFQMAVLKINVNFCTLLIGVEGTKTPAIVRGRGDPAGAKSAEEAPRHAREPLVPGTEINRQV